MNYACAERAAVYSDYNILLIFWGDRRRRILPQDLIWVPFLPFLEERPLEFALASYSHSRLYPPRLSSYLNSSQLLEIPSAGPDEGKATNEVWIKAPRKPCYTTDVCSEGGVRLHRSNSSQGRHGLNLPSPVCSQ